MTQRQVLHGRAIGAVAAAAAIVLLSLNLRPVMSSIPPLTNDIQVSTGWSHAMLGLVTTLPIVCMAVFAPIVPRWAARWGRTTVTAFALVLVLIATSTRLFAGALPWLLPVTAIIAGIGIATGSGLVPALIREWFPDRIGTMTGLYTGSMIFGAAVGAGVSVPLMRLTGTWPDALAMWGLLAVAGVLVWIGVTVRQHGAEVGARARAASLPKHLPWRSPLAWWLSAFMGCNGFVFYALLAWLSPSYNERGWTQDEAGFLLAFSAVVQMLAALVMPRVAQRFPHHRTLLALSPILCAVGIMMIGFMPHTLTLLAITLNGVGLGGGFSLGIMVMTEYSASPSDAARITAMVFLLSYVASAIAPMLTGALYGAFPSWELFYAIMVIVLVLQFLAVFPLRKGRLIH